MATLSEARMVFETLSTQIDLVREILANSQERPRPNGPIQAINTRRGCESGVAPRLLVCTGDDRSTSCLRDCHNGIHPDCDSVRGARLGAIPFGVRRISTSGADADSDPAAPGNVGGVEEGKRLAPQTTAARERRGLRALRHSPQGSGSIGRGLQMRAIPWDSGAGTLTVSDA